MITARGLTVTQRGGVSTLACQVSHGEANLPGELWVSAAGLQARESWDPFLPVLALLSASRGRQLVIEGAASSQLLRALPKTLRIWSAWADVVKGTTMSPTPVLAQGVTRPRQSLGAGCFFSGGVDSFFTLTSNHARYPVGDPRRVKTLVLVHGLDIPLENVPLFADVERAIRAVADQLSCETVVVRTNVKALVAGIDWVVYGHAPCLMAAAYHVSDLVDSIYVPSAYAADEVKPNAVHPLTDSLWSTEYLDVVHDGLGACRGEKIAALARSDVALRFLRVCWSNSENAYNCGRCEKCLRTMMELWISGVLDRCQSFPRVPLEFALRELDVPPHLVSFWQASIARAEAARLDARVIALARRAVDRSVFDATGAGSLLNKALVATEKIGLSRAAIKRADNAILRGAGHGLLRRIQYLTARKGR